MRGSYDTVILLCTLCTQSFVNPGFEGELASEKSIVRRTAQKTLSPLLSSAPASLQLGPFFARGSWLLRRRSPSHAGGPTAAKPEETSFVK